MPWAILGSASLLVFSMVTPYMCIPPMEHIIKEELLLTHTQTSLLITIPVMMTAILSIPCGFLADRIGIRKAAGIGAILIAIGSMLRSTTADFSLLIAFTFIVGVGGTMTLPSLPKMVSLWVPREKAGIATGIYSTGMALGGALPIAITIPLIFPITNTISGTFLIWSIPTIIAAIVWWIVAKDPPRSSTEPSSVNQNNVPLRQILSHKNLWRISILFFLGQFFFMNWTAWSPALMMEKGATADMAGYIASVIFWVAIPTFLLAPLLSQKIGLRKPFIWVSSIILASCSLWAMYIAVPMGWVLMTLVGIGYNTLFVTILLLPIELMPRETVGTASGLTLSIGFAGGVLGTLAGGYILDLTGSLNHSLLVLMGVTITMAAIAFLIPETGPKAITKG